MEILFGFDLNFLIGRSHLPWNPSHPYSVKIMHGKVITCPNVS